MTINPDEIPITITTTAPDALELLSIIREDISRGISPLLTRDDKGAKVMVSVVAQGVFLSAIAENKNGEHRFLDIPVNSVMEMFELKKAQYSSDKGGWLSMVLTVENDGFVMKTEYDYDRKIYSGNTPENWYIAPETETEDYKSVWSDEEYFNESIMFPRPAPFSWQTAD